MNSRELTTRLIAIAVLKKTMTEHENALRLHLRAQLLPGDRQQGAVMPLSLDAAPAQVGYALLTEGSQSWRVTDPAKLLAWAKEATPGEVAVREEVRPAFVAVLLQHCKEDGGWLNRSTGNSPTCQELNASWVSLSCRSSRTRKRSGSSPTPGRPGRSHGMT